MFIYINVLSGFFDGDICVYTLYLIPSAVVTNFISYASVTSSPFDIWFNPNFVGTARTQLIFVSLTNSPVAICDGLPVTSVHPAPEPGVVEELIGPAPAYQ